MRTTTTPISLTPQTLRIADARLTSSCTVMARLVSQHGPCQLLSDNPDPYHTLVTSIIGQQLSTRAAHSITQRISQSVGAFTPDNFSLVSPKTLRSAGLSLSKARYIIDLTKRVADSNFDLHRLHALPDSQVLTLLTQSPGIGPWTAQMFLIFALRRPDVLAIGDAGLHRAVRNLYGTAADLQVTSQSWTPFRSVASWYLWRHTDSM